MSLSVKLELNAFDKQKVQFKDKTI
jgi:hypothetical protein